jgi:hypothetical protein
MRWEARRNWLIRQRLLYRDVDVGAFVEDAGMGERPKKDDLATRYQLPQSHLEMFSGLRVQLLTLATALGVPFL